MQKPRYQKRLPRCVDGVGKVYGGNDFGEEGVVTVGRNRDAIDELNCAFNAGRKFNNNSMFGPSHVDFEDNMWIAEAMRTPLLEFEDGVSDECLE